MNNFLEFIEEDIQNKKTLLSSMPVATKPNIKKFNLKVDDIKKKYEEYKLSVKRYLETKSKSFEISVPKNTEDIVKEIPLDKLLPIKFTLKV